jgi:hypothetical protein
MAAARPAVARAKFSVALSEQQAMGFGHEQVTSFDAVVAVLLDQPSGTRHPSGSATHLTTQEQQVEAEPERGAARGQKVATFEARIVKPLE